MSSALALNIEGKKNRTEEEEKPKKREKTMVELQRMNRRRLVRNISHKTDNVTTPVCKTDN